MVIPKSISVVAPARRSGASNRFLEEMFDRIQFQVALGQKALELGVFVLQFFEAAHVLAFQATILALPHVKGILADTMFPTDLALTFFAAYCFLQNRHNLGVIKLALLHQRLPFLPGIG